MLQRFRAVVVVTAMGAGALAVTPAASAGTSSGPDISKIGVSPNPVVVDSSNGTTATFSFEAGATNAKVVLTAPGAKDGTDVVATNDGTKWKAQYKFTRAHKPGEWNFRVHATSVVGTKVSDSVPFNVRNVYDTRAVDFNASPEDVSQGDTLTLTGRLQIDWGSGWKGYGRGQKVNLTFREKGTDAYRYVTSTVTGTDGWFKARARTWSTGWWRAEFDGNSEAHKAVSDTDRIDVSRAPEPEPEPEERVDSRLIRFNASPEPVRKGRNIKLTAKLQIDDDWGWDGYRARVKVEFKPAGSSRYRYVKTTNLSNGDGDVRTYVRAYTSGRWRVRFAGDSDAYGSTSKSDYVRVKR
ncbi:hypothetical protein SAMN05421505_101256 [Sinosporangium album]|uniref:Ig-like domain (Group 3) n=1 Tax=Sinosporangium album TaxID=504805 RepID=A0A1G7R7C1_9ACTN|nr:hypothetical protein [Sinosporangium album]SDG05860.1 hypothetical protein SAMN05421505_101256 [Sinosporangium album]